MDIISPLLSLLLLAATIAGMWKVFEKAGQPGWKALIPFYNLYVMIKISGNAGWWLAVMLLPILPVAYVEYLTITNPAQFIGLTVPPSVEIAGLIFLFFLLLAVTVQTIILYDITRRCGRGLASALGLTWLPFIFWPILGFGDADYDTPETKSTSGAEGEAIEDDHDDEGEEDHEEHHSDHQDHHEDHDDHDDHDDHNDEHHDHHNE